MPTLPDYMHMGVSQIQIKYLVSYVGHQISRKKANFDPFFVMNQNLDWYM